MFGLLQITSNSSVVLLLQIVTQLLPIQIRFRGKLTKLWFGAAFGNDSNFVRGDVPGLHVSQTGRNTIVVAAALYAFWTSY
jgi:hypothetical protein